MSKRFGSNISTSDAVTLISAPNADSGAIENAGAVSLAVQEVENAEPPSYTTTVTQTVNGLENTICEWGIAFAVIVEVDAPVSLEGLQINWEISETTYLAPDNNASTGTMTVGSDQVAAKRFDLIADPKTDILEADITFTLNPGTSSAETYTFTRPASNENLYDFTDATFTNSGVTGRTGPITGQARTGLSSTSDDSWKNNDDYFTADQGVQKWTVPETATYKIELRGAKGGNNGFNNRTGGSGARFSIHVDLEQETVLNIVVGQQGSRGNGGRGGGGGGGTFVYTGNVRGNELIAAAGGGGGADDSSQNGSSARSDLNPTGGGGVVRVNDGGQGTGSQGNGAGWLSNGTGTRDGRQWQGGTAVDNGHGGFGGGGGDGDDGASGAGFTGGDDSYGAGAGGSYYAGLTAGSYTSIYADAVSEFTWIGANSDHGRVIITKL